MLIKGRATSGTRSESNWSKVEANGTGRGRDAFLPRQRVIPSHSWPAQSTMRSHDGISRISTNSNSQMAPKSADLTRISTTMTWSMKGVSTSHAFSWPSNSSTCSTLATTGHTYAPSPRKLSIHMKFSVWYPTYRCRTSDGGTSQISTAGLGTGRRVISHTARSRTHRSATSPAGVGARIRRIVDKATHPPLDLVVGDGSEMPLTDSLRFMGLSGPERPQQVARRDPSRIHPPTVRSNKVAAFV